MVMNSTEIHLYDITSFYTFLQDKVRARPFTGLCQNVTNSFPIPSKTKLLNFDTYCVKCQIFIGTYIIRNTKNIIEATDWRKLFFMSDLTIILHNVFCKNDSTAIPIINLFLTNTNYDARLIFILYLVILSLCNIFIQASIYIYIYIYILRILAK